MKLQDLLKKVDIVTINGDENKEVKLICTDSRNVERNALFIAIKGVQVDGHNYVENAIEQGASVIVYEEDTIKTDNKEVTFVKVKHSADAAGAIATLWYGDPSSKLKLVGVTGTNGKTTTATLLYNVFRRLGYKAGLLSTVANYVNDKEFQATHTTPDPLTLNEMLAKMVEAGCDYAFMEVSSHAIHQKRISGLNFAGGIFTNLTQDHLDYHHTMEEYLKAKKMFFDELPATAFALTNVDDKNGMVMLQNTKAQKHTYSVRGLADYKGKIIEKHFDGTAIEINGREVQVQFVGVFNVYNLLAVCGAANLLGQQMDEILVTLSALKPVSGRFQTFRSDDGITAIVDYAHTPDALVNVLEAIHEVLQGQGQIITVVGCGGNRDKTKRPIMAREAVRLSNQVILTSDNPRFEEPQAIINDMADGLTSDQQKKALMIVEREQAIRTACKIARTGDVILIAGKGHENYQDVKGVKHHFDDSEIVQELFDIK